MDKNQKIAFMIIGVILIGYSLIFKPEASSEEGENSADTTVTVTNPEAKTDSITPINPVIDSSKTVATTEKTYLVETEELKITFSSIGGKIKAVELKNFKTHDSLPLILFDELSAQLEVNINNNTLASQNFTSTLSDKNTVSEDELIAIFSGNGITQTYTIPSKGFQIKYKINGVKGSSASYNWTESYKQVEEDLTLSYQKSGINYYTTEGEFDDYGTGKSDEDLETIEGKIKWISNKQRFFSSAIIADQNIQNLNVKSNVKGCTEGTFKKVKSTFKIPAVNGQVAYTYYFGPNDYDILKEVTEGFKRNITLGWGIFRWMNEGVVIPIFKFLTTYISNYGLAILALVFIIKMLLLPIAYRSYLSMAKMKELKPELDALKAKHGDDQMASQQSSMALYKEVGVNPMAGCIPPLLQMPVLLALFQFFPNWFAFRQEAFLFAHDLSTSDRIITFPAIFGGFDHISIFTLLMTLSTLAYTYYNNKFTSSAQMQGPMKTMTYLMPLVFFFMLNSYSAGLTFYYFVSNIITIAQQNIATRFIDKDKIRQKMDENKKNRKDGTAKKSITERFADKARQKMDEVEQNNKKR